VVAQVVLVAWESRVAGLEQSAGHALLLSVPAFALVWLVLLAAARFEHRASAP
jgi:hypothetical protein